MKYLQDYIKEEQTRLFEKYKVFFAFSEKQLQRGMDKYNITDRKELVAPGGGMVLPEVSLPGFLDEHAALVKRGIVRDIEENGINAVIVRELGNYECYYTGDTTDAIEALVDYGVTADDVNRVFKNKNAEVHATPVV